MLRLDILKRVTIPIIANYILVRAIRKSQTLLPMEVSKFNSKIRQETMDYVSRLKLVDIERLEIDSNNHQRHTIFDGNVMKIRERLVYAVAQSAVLLYQEYLGGVQHTIKSFGDADRTAKKILDSYSIKGIYDENI